MVEAHACLWLIGVFFSVLSIFFILPMGDTKTANGKIEASDLEANDSFMGRHQLGRRNQVQPRPLNKRARVRVNRVAAPALLQQQIRGGLSARVPETILPNILAQNTSKNIEIKGFKECPAVIVLNEKEAMIFFKFIGGCLDYAGFHGDDPVFMNWVHDLFMYYWERGSRNQVSSS